MSEQTPVDKSSPLWLAWQRFQANEEYANTKRWALVERHTEGSLWAAFEAGFSAAHPSPLPSATAPAAPPEQVADTEMLCEALDNTYGAENVSLRREAARVIRAYAAEVARLTRKNDEWEGRWTEEREYNASLGLKLFAADESLAALRARCEALEQVAEYALHDPNCTVTGPHGCSCGLNAARTALGAAPAALATTSTKEK